MEPFQDERLTVAGLFFEAHQGLVAVLERRLRSECDLSLGGLELLVRLARSPGRRLRMTDLAAQTGLSRSGLTRAVDRLAQCGLVSRTVCPEDGRGAFAVLSDEGHRRAEAAVLVYLDDLDHHLVGRLTPAELGQLARISRRLRDHLRPEAALVTGS